MWLPYKDWIVILNKCLYASVSIVILIQEWMYGVHTREQNTFTLTVQTLIQGQVAAV